MWDLVGYPEDQFYCVTAYVEKDLQAFPNSSLINMKLAVLLYFMSTSTLD